MLWAYVALEPGYAGIAPDNEMWKECCRIGAAAPLTKIGTWHRGFEQVDGGLGVALVTAKGSATFLLHDPDR